MKKLSNTFVFIICATLFLFSQTSQIFGQWVQTNGPYGGPVNCFAFSGDNVFAGTPYGIFLSTDNGTNWSAINSGLTNSNIICLVTSQANGDTNIFAGTPGGAFRTSNKGANWIAVNNGLANTTINTLAVISDSTGAYVFAGTKGGIFRSTDNGLSWAAADTGLIALRNNDNKIYSIISIPSSTGPGSGSGGINIFAATWDGIYISTNYGLSWALTNSAMSDVNVLAAIATPTKTNLYAAENGGVFISTDNGKNWIKRSFGFIDSSVTAFAVSPFTGVANSSDSTINLFAGTRSRGVYFSTDNGLSWTPMDTGLTNEDMHSLIINSTNSGGTNLFAGTEGGAFLSTNCGTSWHSINTGMSNTRLLSLTSVPVNNGTNLLAGTETGIYLSTNNGISWDEVMNSNGLLNTVSASSFTEYTNNKGGTNIFAGTANGIYLSRDNGASWSLVLPGVPGSSFVLIPNGSGTNIFAGTYTIGIFLSTDNGNTWNGDDNGLSDFVVFSMAISPLSTGGTDIFAEIGASIVGEPFPTRGVVYSSTNNGANWNYILHPELPLVNSFAVTPNKTSSTPGGMNLFAGTSKGVYLSTNNDTTWVYKGLADYVVNSLTVFPSDTGTGVGAGETNLFAGTNNGVFLSTDNGRNWAQVNTGLTNKNIKTLSFDGTYLYAGNYGGSLWKRPLSEMITDVKDKQNNIPTTFSLQQNYPNPFNPVTVISWSAPGGAVGNFVTLKVYDILGREVKTLVNEQQAAGTHSITFNAERLPSGVYFYRLAAGNFIQTKKLVLIK